MPLSRRKTLALIGGGLVTAAAGSSAAFVATRTPHRALAPWDAAGGYDDPRLNALSWALLAPNPHNRQPWEAELIGEDTVRLTRDPNRDLPETDPYGRQLTVGMGCFIELMVLAAGADGFEVELDLFPEGEGPTDPVAIARFVPGGTADPLFAEASARRSCKEPFDMTRPVPQTALATLATASGPGFGATLDPLEVDALRELAKDAWTIEAYTPAAFAESVDLLRIGRPEIEATPDGIDLQSPMLEVLRRTGLLTREALLDTEGAGFQGTLETYMATFDATPAFVWLTTTSNDRLAQIAAGRAWLRLNLATTAAGLGLQPVSQALQEFPEMAEPYARVHALLAGEGETVQMLGRLGYGPDVPRTPRWSLETRLINA